MPAKKTVKAPKAPKTQKTQKTQAAKTSEVDKLIVVVAQVAPTIIAQLMTDRAAERAHELVLLEKDREYAIERLKSSASESADVATSVTSLAVQAATLAGGQNGHVHVPPPAPKTETVASEDVPF